MNDSPVPHSRLRSKQPEKPRADWALVTLGIILALLLAWGLGYVQARGSDARLVAGVGKDQQHRFAECNAVSSIKLIECLKSAIANDRAEIRAEQTLNADQRSSVSALAGAIVSVGALIASVVGLIFVKRTLDATLKAVQDTGESVAAMGVQNRLALNAQRPWLAVTNVKCTVCRGSDGYVTYSVAYDITNYGDTPAAQVRGIVMVSPSEWQKENDPHAGSFARLASRKPFGGAIIFPSEVKPQGRGGGRHGWNREPMPEFFRTRIRIGVLYASLQSDEPLFTGVNFEACAPGSTSNRLMSMELAALTHEQSEVVLIEMNEDDVLI